MSSEDRFPDGGGAVCPPPRICRTLGVGILPIAVTRSRVLQPEVDWHTHRVLPAYVTGID